MKKVLIPVSLILLCGCTNTTTSTTVTNSPSLEPSVSASVSVSPSTTPVVSNTPLQTPSSIVISATPTSTVTPTASVNPTLVPTPTSSPSQGPKVVTISGIVENNDDASKLESVELTVKSMNSAVPYEKKVTTDALGRYKFTDIPAKNVTYLISAYKPGYTKRERSFVIIDLDTELKNFDFSGDVYGLSDRPEVIGITPEYGVIAPGNTSFTLTFNESMNRGSVESCFAITSDKLSTVTLGAGFQLLPWNNSSGTVLYDKNAFNITWAGDTKATFTLKNEQTVPCNNSGEVQYRLILNYTKNGMTNIKDSAGCLGRIAVIGSKSDGPFHTMQYYQPYSAFSISADNTSPTINDIRAMSPNTINVIFTKPMYLTTADAQLLSGSDKSTAPAGNGTVTAADAATNYTLKVNDNPVLVSVTRSDFYQDDLTHKTVQLTTDPAKPFSTNDKIELTVKNSIVDPAGNALTGTTTFIKTAL